MGKSLADKLYTARTNLGLSQARLAKKAGIAQSTICDIEAGRRNNPRITTLWKLAKALEMTLSELLKEKN